MLRSFFGNLIFGIIARMLCGNHLNLSFFPFKRNDPCLEAIDQGASHKARKSLT